jgi:hypothetical protein
MSSILFSPNTNVFTRAEICETLHINTEAISDKYLGLATLVGTDKSECFLNFVKRIIQRTNVGKISFCPLIGNKYVESGCPRNPNLCYVGISNTKRSMGTFGSLPARALPKYWISLERMVLLWCGTK